MKVIFGPEIFFQKYGGISRYFVRLAENLVLLGHDVQIATPWHANEFLRVSLPFRNGSKFFEVKSENLARLVTLGAQLKSRADLLRSEADVYHPTYYSFSSLRPKNALRAITVYDMIHERGFLGDGKLAQRKNLRKTASIARSQVRIAISESTKRDLIELSDFPPESISTVPLGVDFPSEVFPTPATIDFPYLLYVGNRHGYKNFSVVLEAFQYLRQSGYRDLGLVVAGGEPLGRDENSRILSVLGGAQLFRHLNADETQLSGLYVGALALVFPSMYEGFGLPILEAMAHGCPVVSANSSSLPEVAGDAALYFDPADPQQLVAQVLKVSEESGLRKNLIDQGTQRAAEYSWEACARRTAQVYSVALERASNG